ncbi:MAG: hypothetical protein RMY28_009345 [Nostoc sp. ChiSLP01]|nr:hypothetical protein [Nostoc sp. CmiSLP01]MDZ8285240.1 hypothetical protein [Nostoc sp. ChiSLP01]
MHSVINRETIHPDIPRRILCDRDAEIVASTVNEWKCGPIAIVYYSSFGMVYEIEEFRTLIKPAAEAIVHDALMAGRQVFLVNLMGDWPAYPELEQVDPPKGYSWMRILYDRSTLQISLLVKRGQLWRKNFDASN